MALNRLSPLNQQPQTYQFLNAGGDHVGGIACRVLHLKRAEIRLQRGKHGIDAVGTAANGLIDGNGIFRQHMRLTGAPVVGKENRIGRFDPQPVCTITDSEGGQHA